MRHTHKFIILIICFELLEFTNIQAIKRVIQETPITHIKVDEVNKLIDASLREGEKEANAETPIDKGPFYQRVRNHLNRYRKKYAMGGATASALTALGVALWTYRKKYENANETIKELKNEIKKSTSNIPEPSTNYPAPTVEEPVNVPAILPQSAPEEPGVKSSQSDIESAAPSSYAQEIKPASKMKRRKPAIPGSVSQKTSTPTSIKTPTPKKTIQTSTTEEPQALMSDFLYH